MSSEFVYLRAFTPEELIFDEEETKEILTFIFPSRASLIQPLVINDKIREFAQGLLVEAVDASYALGFVAIIFRFAYFQPGLSAFKFLAKFIAKASSQWFKHAKATDLATVKIYDRVRDQLQRAFDSDFVNRYINNITKKENTSAAFVDYASAFNKNNNRIWT